MNEPSKVHLTAGAETFPVTFLKHSPASPTLLFAAGRGGSPDRHDKLLQAFNAGGFNVVAPHFEMLPDPVPTRAELLERADRLSRAVEQLVLPESDLFGVGHSIGASMLLIMAGATAYTIKREPIVLPLNRSFKQLALMAPAIDFFRGPNALDELKTPLKIFCGAQDRIVPLSAIQFFESLCPPTLVVKTEILPDAHHFTFMDQMPPHIEDDDPNRGAQLKGLYIHLIRDFDV